VFLSNGSLFIANTAAGTVEVVDGDHLRHLLTIPDCPEASGGLVAQEEGLVFAAARGVGKLLVIDATSATVRRTVAVGVRPNGLAWDSLHKHLLVADVEDHLARLVDSQAGQVIATAPLPGRPRWAVYQKALDCFLVTIREPAVIALLSASPFSQVGQVPIAVAGPHGLDLDRDGRRAFVACDGGSVVTVDVATGKALAQVPIGGVPDGFCQNSNNLLAEKPDFCYADRIKAGFKKEYWPMNCPYCAATGTKKRTKKTKLGYATFFCPQCCRSFNERTGTSFNSLEFPTDIVLLAVFWRLRYKLSLRDVAERFLERGFAFTHEAIRDWEARFTPLITDQLPTKRHGHAGRSWYVDETYLKVHGKWWYLSRAIDHDGNLIDSRLSEKRDMDAAKPFFKQAVAVVGHTPETITTDGHRSSPRAIHETMGNDVVHRTNKSLNNHLEQDHRAIKQRYSPMRGFGTVEAAARFCCAFDELRTYLRPRRTMGEVVSLLEQRQTFLQRLAALQTVIQAAS